MGSMHSLLRRQLKRFFADPSNLPEELTGFIQAVNDAYMQSDNDRGMLERSLDLSSQELMHANSELRAIFEAIPDLFFRIDANGKILSIKSGSTVDLYLPPARFIGKYLQDFPEPAIAQLLSNAIKEVGTRKTLVNVEYELQRDEHSEFFEARLLPLLENQIVVIIRNITERKQAEESIERSLSLHRATLESSINGILVVNHAGKMVSFNRRFVEMWGIPEAIVASKNDHKALSFVQDQLKEPELFLKKVKELYKKPLAESFDVLEFKNGRVFERYSMPQLINGNSVGRVWSFLDITERKHAEDHIKASLQEKEVLLQEIHHRVKNNLQIVSSLLSLQTRYISQPELLAIFRESQNRIRSMALIHEKLYRSDDLARIDFGEYLRNLVNHLYRSYAANSDQIQLEINIKNIRLDIDTAVPYGLIINELISNSLKYAFPEQREGCISIAFSKPQPNKHVLSVGDNGIGFPEEFSIDTCQSLGLRLVKSLTQQLNGRFEISMQKGTHFIFTFQIENPAIASPAASPNPSLLNL